MSEHKHLHPDGLSRIETVLELIPISRTAWYRGIREGRYPPPVKLSPQVAAWRNRDILAVADRLSNTSAA